MHDLKLSERMYLACGESIHDNAALVTMTEERFQDFAKEVADLESGDSKLRSELWSRHGHGYPALYGDDGQRHCNACLIDFKRDPVDVIVSRLQQNARERGQDYLALEPLITKRVEQVEKLTVLLSEAEAALSGIAQFFDQLEKGADSDDPLRKLREQFHKPVREHLEVLPKLRAALGDVAGMKISKI
jgi:hypothetical protein